MNMAMKNGWRKCIQFVLVLCLAITGGLAAGCAEQVEKSPDEVSFISPKLDEINELAVVKMCMKGILPVSAEESPMIDEKVRYMSYHACVTVGMDLTMSEITITEDKVQIDLPKVERLDIVVDENRLEFLDVSRTRSVQEVPEDTTAAISAAKEDVLAQPEMEELKKTAIKQAETLLRGLLEEQIGDRELIINVG